MIPMADLADSEVCDHFGGGQNVVERETLRNWTFLKKIFFLNFLQPNLVQNRSVSLYTGIAPETLLVHFMRDFLYNFFAVFSNYFLNEMRYAKKKSFRLNRILRPMFEQSFEEIVEPSVVVVVVVTPFHLCKD